MADTSSDRLSLKLRFWWQEARASFWFVPAMIVAGAVGVATLMVAVDASVEIPVVDRWPLLFGAGAAGSRGLLTAVASSMITVAGVVFSITIVALSLTSSQYTSRVLGNFMGDRINQVVLGVFVGIFAYCLVVLRTIRGGDEGAFVPRLAVLFGLVLAFVGIAFLIFFIHHIAKSIQASSIIAAAAKETLLAVDRLFPKGIGNNIDESPNDLEEHILDQHSWFCVMASKTGYIESIDGNACLNFARKHCVVLRMEAGIGEFIIQGTPLISISSEIGGDTAAQLNGYYVIGRQRTVQQDAGYGIRQIVDIAIKALSPGINDTTTAVMCVDYLAAILIQLTSREFPSLYRMDQGETRVIAKALRFENLLALAFNQIRQNGGGNVAVMVRLLDSLRKIAQVTTHEKRRSALLTEANLVSTTAAATIPNYDLPTVLTAKSEFLRVFESAANSEAITYKTTR